MARSTNISPSSRTNAWRPERSFSGMSCIWGEINSTQQEAWRKTIEIFEDGQVKPKTVALFPQDRAPAISSQEIVQIRLQDLQLRRPRQWGACWLATELYEKLELDRFWAEKLPPSRKGTRWDLVLQTLVTYRLVDPGSEWKLHCLWFEATAMADLLGEDFSLAESQKLYECMDLLLAHKQALFDHLTARWKDLFNAQFDVLQLTQVEEAFKNLKGDLALRPLFHKKEARIEAHIFVSFLAYCLHVTPRRWLRDLAPGLS